jgi:hypothetical protein
VLARAAEMTDWTSCSAPLLLHRVPGCAHTWNLPPPQLLATLLPCPPAWPRDW